jgi:hypothetical protein
VRFTVLVIVLVAMGFLAGCRDSPPAPPKATVAAAASDPRADGEAAAQRSDWAAAATHYALALQREPEDLKLRFAYGSVLSHLDRVADTTEQFAWVVKNGPPGSLEVITARQWLQQTGAVAHTPERAPAAPERVAETSELRVDPRTGLLEGKSAWPGVGPDEKIKLSLRMRLRGEDEANKTVQQRLNVEIGTGFTWQRLAPGRYRLVGESKGVTLWDVPVTVDANKTTTVDLSPSNSGVPATDFPPRS